MRGHTDLSTKPLKNRRQSRVDPSSVGFADTFSRKGRRIPRGKSDTTLREV